MSHTVKSILKRAAKLRKSGHIHPNTELAVLVLVEKVADGLLPNIANELSRQDNVGADGLNINIVISERSALSAERVLSLTVMAIVDHLTSPIQDGATRVALHNATVTAQYSLDCSYQDLVY